MYRDHSIFLTTTISVLVACRSLGASHPPSTTTSHHSYSSPHVQSPAPPPPPPPWGAEDPWRPPGAPSASSPTTPHQRPSPSSARALFTSSTDAGSPSASSLSSLSHHGSQTRHNDTVMALWSRRRYEDDETNRNSHPSLARMSSWM